MGLDIGYETLRDYLTLHLSDDERISERVRRAEAAIRDAIRVQTGKRVALGNARVPKNLEGFKFGLYSEIHYLRAFAARSAGYLLEEAYALDMPVIAIEESIEEATEGGSPQTEGDAGEDDPDDDLDRQLESTFPISKKKLKPFPYPQLVCFSDSQGIYLPVAFRDPILVEDCFVGSSAALLNELADVGKRAARMLSKAIADENPALEHYMLYVRELWLRLRHPCQESLRCGVPFIFQ